MANPLTEDSKLKRLLNDVSGIPDEVQFQRWRDSFLSALDKHLTKDATGAADVIFKRFAKGVGSLARDVRRLEQFKERGELKGDAALRCMGTMTDKITVVTTAMRKLIPVLGEEEKRAGFTKFNMTAVLVLDGFVEYDRLEKIQIHLGRLRKEGLGRIAQSNTLEAIDKYGDAYDNMCETLMNVGIYPVVDKCASFIKGDWVPQSLPRKQSSEDLTELKEAIKKNGAQNSSEPTVDSTSESTLESARQRDNGRQVRPRGRDERPVRGPRAKSVGAQQRSDGPQRGMRRTSSDQMESSSVTKSPTGKKISMNLKRPSPGANGRSDREPNRGGLQRSKSLGPPTSRSVASTGSDDSDLRKATSFLRPNLRDNNATVRQKKDTVATNKRQAAGPTPWRQRMQEERQAKKDGQNNNENNQGRAPMARRKSFGGFTGALESSNNGDKPKAPDGADARGRGRSMTPWRSRGGPEENAPARRRGVSLGRKLSPQRDRAKQDDDSAARSRRTTTPYRRRPGDTSSRDDDTKSLPGRVRAPPPDRRGRSQTPSATRRTDAPPKSNGNESSIQKNSMKPKRDGRQSPPPSNEKASMKLNRDTPKGSPSKVGSMKLSREGAKNLADGKGDKAKKQRGPNDAGKDSKRKVGRFFKKKGKNGKELEDTGDAFSIEDSTPDEVKQSKSMTMERPKRPKKPSPSKSFDAPASPSRLFRPKAEFAAPRRAKSMPLDQPASPFKVADDDPFSQAADPFADTDDPFAKAADPFADSGPNFVGVDDSSSDSDDEDESSTGSEESDESGSFFTSSEEDDESGSEESDSSDDEEGSSEDESEEKPKRRRKPRAKAESLPAEVLPESPTKGHLPKRKAPQGKPDEDGFCPCCGQGWPGYDKWSKMML